MCIGWGPTTIYVKPSSADPCTTAGCTGTYLFCWTGEYSGDSDKACLNSGASTVDASGDNGSTIGAGGAINGSVGALLDNAADYVYWAFTAANVDESGTISFLLAVPAGPFTTTSTFYHLYSSTDTDENNISSYTDDSEQPDTRYEGSADSGYSGPTDAVSASTTYTICATWNVDVGGDSVCTARIAGVDPDCSTASWDCTAATITEFNDPAAFFQIGNDCASAGGDSACDNQALNTTGWKVDDVYIYDDYKGS